MIVWPSSSNFNITTLVLTSTSTTKDTHQDAWTWSLFQWRLCFRTRPGPIRHVMFDSASTACRNAHKTSKYTELTLYKQHRYMVARAMTFVAITSTQFCAKDGGYGLENARFKEMRSPKKIEFGLKSSVLGQSSDWPAAYTGNHEILCAIIGTIRALSVEPSM